MTAKDEGVEEAYEKLLEVNNEMMRCPPYPEKLWGRDLALGLILLCRAILPDTVRALPLAETSCMSFFEMGRRYERRWPKVEVNRDDLQ